MTEIRLHSVADAVEHMGCMDEKDLECSHCGGLTAHAMCEDIDLIHCIHCGNPMDTRTCTQHKVDKKAPVPRHV